MSDERLRIDSNAKGVVGGVTDDAGLNISMFRVDPTTKRLLVDATITTGMSAQTGIADGDAINIADTGVLALGTDGSNYQILKTDSNGELQVDILNASIAVTGTFWQTTQPISGTITANLSATDNAVLDTIDSVLDAINAKLVTGTDIGDVTINNASGAAAVNIQDGGNTITVDGTVAVTGTFWQTTQPVSIASMPSTPVTGTFWQATQPISGTITANLSATDNAVLDDIAADTESIKGYTDGIETVLGTIDTDTGNMATSLGNLNNSVDGNYLNVNMNIAGTDISATVPMPVRPTEFELASVTTHVKKYYTSAGAATDGIIWSPAAGKRWYVTDIFIQVSAAATVTLEDDLAAGDSAIWKAELAANSGWSHSFNTPWYSGEDAADLIITTSAANVYVTVTGYEI